MIACTHLLQHTHMVAIFTRSTGKTISVKKLYSSTAFVFPTGYKKSVKCRLMTPTVLKTIHVDGNLG